MIDEDGSESCSVHLGGEVDCDSCGFSVNRVYMDVWPDSVSEDAGWEAGFTVGCMGGANVFDPDFDAAYKLLRDVEGGFGVDLSEMRSRLDMLREDALESS